MDSSFFLGVVAAAIAFTVFRKFRFHQENEEETNSSSLSPSSPPSALSLSSASPSSSSHNSTHQVFPSFRGEDVRRDFLSHVQAEFQRKGITPFIDNEINRGEFIGPELIRAIRGSKIAIVLLSMNYASSSWCLDELVEIMKCREELGQKVIPVFYKVDPSDVKKLRGHFGSVFRNTCAGKTNEAIQKWRQALAKVATITGYDSHNWDNEATMIEEIAVDILKVLNYSTPSRDFEGLIGMGARMKELEKLLCLESNEVKMIGIWGPPGIGKTTISRVLFNHYKDIFEFSVFMENIKELTCTRPLCSDDYGAKLSLQRQFLSKIFNHKDIEIPHLGVVEDRLNDKKVFVVLDNINQSIQLEAIAKEARWFGHGSRFIVTTQDRKLLKEHAGINHIYKVDYPSTLEACQIFCMYAFGQKFPKDGFEELTLKVTVLLGQLPLGLRVMGSYFQGMSKQEWTDALPRLRTRLDGETESILKFSYDALEREEKDLFLYIACFFNDGSTIELEEILAKNFLDVRHSLRILAEKSLIWSHANCYMHKLLVKLGREIVQYELGQQSICEPGKRRFLVDIKDICEVLNDDTPGSRNVIGIDLNLSEMENKLNVCERPFKRMSNLKFLRFHCPFGSECKSDNLYLPQGLNYLSQKLILLEWEHFPMTCLPSNFCTVYLVKLKMWHSKLQKLWESNQPLGNLKWMDLSYSKNLKELPDLSTAINLQELILRDCSSLVEVYISIENVTSLQNLDLSGWSSLVELPSSIENATNLQKLVLSGCSSLVKLPFSIGNLINLQFLILYECSSLVELPPSIGNATNLKGLCLSMCTSLVELPSSIGNLHKLVNLSLCGCIKLEVLPININMESLRTLELTDCSLLKSFPEISTNIECLELIGTAIKEVPSSIKSWPRLNLLRMSYNAELEKSTHAPDVITMLHLNDTEMQEIPLWVSRISRLRRLVLSGCKNLVSLPQLSDSVCTLDAENCKSLERLNCSFQNPKIVLNFANCLKLNKEAKELIIQTSSNYAVLPGGEVPAHFTYRATSGSSMRVKMKQRHLSTTSRFKACVLLVAKSVDEAGDENKVEVSYSAEYKQNGLSVDQEGRSNFLPALLTEHLYIQEIETKVTFDEIVFSFNIQSEKWEIGEGGVLQLF